MTTKNFSQMTTKKLKALLETASDEDKNAIEAILAKREQLSAEEEAIIKAAEETEQLSAEEEAIIKAAEENNGLNPLYNGSKATLEKKPKMTDEELHSLAEELRKNINHRCQAVPFNTAEWVDGYIAGVVEEKRSRKVLYAIKTDDGRRIVKVHDSNLIRVLDEVIVPERKARIQKTTKSKINRIEWTPEILAGEINKYIDNVGKAVEFDKYHTVKENGEETAEKAVGRIMAIVSDKRTQILLYRISVLTPTEDNPNATKFVHKIVTSESLNIAEAFDEEGAKINAKYKERREAAISRSPLTPQDRVMRCEENVKKVEEKMRKLQEELDAKKQQLAEAKAELDKFFAEQATSDNAVSSEEEPLA